MPLGGGVRILLRMSIPASLSVVESRGGIAGPVLTLPPPALVSVPSSFPAWGWGERRETAERKLASSRQAS